MKVCALILNYNTFDYVKSLVDILYFNDKIDYICVVDNCSSDTSWDEIKKLNNKKTYVFKSDFNGGYSFGNNYGIKKMLLFDPNIDCFLICNPDIIVDEKTINAILEKINCFPKIGICSCFRKSIDGQFNQVQCWELPSVKEEMLKSLIFGKFYYKRKNIFYNKFNVENFKNVVIPGSFFCIKTDLLKKMEYFDEKTFLYYEENILFSKMLKTDYTSCLLTEFSYIHNHDFSKKINIKEEMQKYKVYLKSKKYFFETYLSNNSLLKNINNVLIKYDYFIHYVMTFIRNLFLIKRKKFF